MQRTTHLCFILSILLAGCVTEQKAEPLQPLVFPPPPEEPRFVFERTVIGSADIKSASANDRWHQILTGERDVSQGFGKPFDVTVCQGHMFVSDTVRRLVLAFNVPQHDYYEIGRDEPGSLSKPLGLATDGDCNLYVVDATTRRVVVYDQGGRYLTAVGGQELLQRPSHVAVDQEGERIYVVDTGGVQSQDHRIRVFSGDDGRHLYDIGTRGKEGGQFNLPRDIDIGPDGLLYVVDGGNFRVQVLDRDGAFKHTFGQIGRRTGQFSRPKGIALDPDGNVYVSDAAFGNLQIFNADGELLMFVGSRSEKFGRATYMLPAGIEVDEDGRIYMVDQFFRKIDVYRPFGLAEQEGYLGAWNVPARN